MDKTAFIKEWWENNDSVTLITRPRRFGKTLNLSTLNCFFSVKYKERADLFENLHIWEEEKYRRLQGTYPVIFLSFATVKSVTYESARESILLLLEDLYQQYSFLLEDNILTPKEAEPERFYHGFVLGLLVELADKYYVLSNRESGFGRYDVMLEPLNKADRAFIFEFKVYNPVKDKNLEEAARNALEQIEEKRYSQTLIERGIREGKKVFISGGTKGQEM